MLREIQPYGRKVVCIMQNSKPKQDMGSGSVKKLMLLKEENSEQ